MATEPVEQLALQALDLARNSLLVNLRFMGAAFARLSLLPVPGATLATDGAHLRYDPAAIARLYAAEPAAPRVTNSRRQPMPNSFSAAARSSVQPVTNSTSSSDSLTRSASGRNSRIAA